MNELIGDIEQTGKSVWDGIVEGMKEWNYLNNLDKMTLEQACFEKQDGFCVNIFDGHVETISEDF